MLQNTPDGTVIGTMKAIDRDLDPVTLYSINSINSTTDTDGLRMITDIVQINERTGEITKSGNTTLSSVENAVITVRHFTVFQYALYKNVFVHYITLSPLDITLLHLYITLLHSYLNLNM